VAGDTLANARALGLTTCELERSFDLDRIEDLERLAAARREATDGLAELCPRTLEILDREGWWPTRRDG
jgi:phosphoribosyl-dephospho-CoA transferase